MTLDLRLNPASFRRHINTSTDVRTGRQVDVGYWLYDQNNVEKNDYLLIKIKSFTKLSNFQLR